MKTPKHSVITSFLSRTRDRFHEYNEPKTLEWSVVLPAYKGETLIQIYYYYGSTK